MSEKISIIVPIYNAGKTLSRCISSIINQTYTNLEIILVNDGSKDNSLKICTDFSNKDKRIKVIDKKNAGVSAARNEGLDNATGKFVMFCDSDDVVNLNWCKVMLDEYDDNSLLMCKYVELSENESIDDSSFVNSYSIHNYDKKQFMLYRDVGIGSPTTKLFCLEIINSNNIRFPSNISLGEDLIFVARYLYYVNAYIKYIDCGLYYYIQYNKSSLSTAVPTYDETTSLFDLISDCYVKMGIKDSQSVSERDRMIARDFEKIFVKIKSDTKSSFLFKYKLVRNGMGKTVYKQIVKNNCVNFSSNKIYDFSLKSRQALLFMLL